MICSNGLKVKGVEHLKFFLKLLVADHDELRIHAIFIQDRLLKLGLQSLLMLCKESI